MEPGEWFNIGQISYLLQKIQNSRPMKGADNLKVLSFNQSMIFLDDVFSILKVQMCRCKVKKIKCDKCHREGSLKTIYKRSSSFEIKEQESVLKRQKSVSPKSRKADHSINGTE